MRYRLLIENEDLKITNIAPINCGSIIDARSIKFDDLKQRYGNEYYLVSLFSNLEDKSWNMAQTTRFIQFLIYGDYGYFPVYVVDQMTETIQNIFLFVFNYHPTPSIHTIVGEHTAPNPFEEDIKSA